jgi:uncharacterized coiled-coil DUF342 family protein
LSQPPSQPQKTPEEKKKLEELKKRLWDLRSRIEKWAMLKIQDVSELNAVYREIGEIARELAKMNPLGLEARKEAEELQRRVEEELKKHEEAVRKIIEIFKRRNAPSEAIEAITRASKHLGGLDLYNYVVGVAMNYEVPLSPRDEAEIRRALGLM